MEVSQRWNYRGEDRWDTEGKKTTGQLQLQVFKVQPPQHIYSRVNMRETGCTNSFFSELVLPRVALVCGGYLNAAASSY